MAVKSPCSTNPDDGSFNLHRPEEPHFQLTESEELQLRIQCIERVISHIPIASFEYANELKRAGLEKLDSKLAA